MDKPLEIIYRDESFIAVNKPPGLLVHRSPIDKKEKRFALQMVRNLVNRHVYPVHRLDRPTSGVLLFALSPETLKQTSALFQTGQVTKKYLAVVRGYIPETGTIIHPVKDVRDRFLSQKERQPTEKRPDSVTGYVRLATVELPVCVDKYPVTRYSLAALYPETGRRHQLRQHMKHISHPIVGDTKYGKDVHNKFFARELGCHGLLLSAVELRFTHPATGKPVTIQAAPHPDFALILNRFNWNIS
ncbi:MAG: pseudouridylate synthase [Desulfobacteraceae bacterium]|nr:MAG: pseudouridylate synthase [Desulfobacteraceae bacterium]